MESLYSKRDPRLAAGARVAACAALLLAPVLVTGCNKKMSLPAIFNSRPSIRLSAAPIDTLGADGKRATYIYHYRINWVGYDADGRVSYYLYTIDPPGSPGGGRNGRDPGQWADPNLPRVTINDTTYCRTTLNEKEVFFTANAPDTVDGQISQSDPHSSSIHTFVIKAVDNTGAFSEPEYRSFFSNTQAPTVRIDEPPASAILYALVTPFVKIHWVGDDPDGVFTQKPVKYKFKLYKDGDVIFPGGNANSDFELARFQPDSVRRAFAPTFAGWDSSTADTTFHTYTRLTPDSRYLFFVVAYDEAGAYSPIFNRNSSVLQMQVGFAGNQGPRITVFNEFFNYTYPSGGYSQHPSRYINLEIPAFRPVRFNWIAEASQGSEMKQYRWSMDIQNLDDQTQREDEASDFKHWSQWGRENRAATVGPFVSDTTHFFYIEAEDVNGLKSLGIVSFRVVVPTFNNDLLIVNDTRMLPDEVLMPPDPLKPDSLQRPIGPWPTHAELDTFLFARGGVRWRMTPNGTVSPPGVFAGYRFDTVYTLAGGTNGFVTLDTLGAYKNVIWITDATAATGLGGRNNRGVLRGMSGPGRANTLAAYISLGGRVWLAGGSAIDATMLDWNIANNDRDAPFGVRKYSSRLQAGRIELVPGRMVVDQMFWLSEIWILGIDTAVPHKSVRAVGGWPSFVDVGGKLVRSPDYSLLPSRMNKKNPADDPVPPNRSLSSFYNSVNVLNCEVLVDNNEIAEDANPEPDSTVMVSTLDTLLIMTGGPLTSQYGKGENEDLSERGRNYHSNPIMTYYHGFQSAPIVVSGFDLWSFSKKDIVKLADFVLQQVWGLPKEPVVRVPAATATAARVRERR